MPHAPDALTIPADSYFVVQDGDGVDSQVLGLVKTEQVIGLPALRIGSRGWADALR